MADYVSVDVLLSAAEDYDWISGLKTVLKRIPVADVVEVVRCKDCIHYDDRWKRCFYWGKVSDIHVIEIGYCWRAERRADNG